MMANVRVSNLIATGRIPVKEKIDYEKIIKGSKMFWQVTNEEITPICSTRINRDRKELNLHKKPKSIYVSIWHSGAINITGVRSLQEAEKIYNYIILELKRIKAIQLKKQGGE